MKSSFPRMLYYLFFWIQTLIILLPTVEMAKEVNLVCNFLWMFNLSNSPKQYRSLCLLGENLQSTLWILWIGRSGQGLSHICPSVLSSPCCVQKGLAPLSPKGFLHFQSTFCSSHSQKVASTPTSAFLFPVPGACLSPTVLLSFHTARACRLFL